MLGPMPSATIAELSRLSGCSAATVSRALNNNGAVSAKARQAVFKVLKETQYLQKKARKRGRNGVAHRSKLVEIILHRESPIETLSIDPAGLRVGPLTAVPDSHTLRGPDKLSGSFQRQIVDGVLSELERCGYRGVIQASKDLLSPALLADVSSVDRAGVLLLGEYTPHLAEFVSLCLHPLVLVDLMHDGAADVVTTDNMLGVGKAFDHLYGLGHRKIGFAGKLDRVVAFAERFSAYKYKMAEAGLKVAPHWVHEGPNHIDTTAAGIRPLLGHVDRPTAILCANDCTAFGVLRGASEMGIAVPSQLSVVGFDDEEAASLVTPALTTVHVPMAEIGRQAVRQLMIQMQLGASNRTCGCRIRMLPELVVRSSAAAPTS